MYSLMGKEARNVVHVMIRVGSIRTRIKSTLEREQRNTFIILTRLNIHAINTEILHVAHRIGGNL